MGYSQSTLEEGNNYQFTSLHQVIDQFIVAYVGEDKTISKVKRGDVAFHAQRALQELSFDTLKSTKAQEIIIPPSLMMQLPKDYVNYTKVSWVDSAGIKHLLYPASKTSNPTPILQNTNGTYYSNLISNGNFQYGTNGWSGTAGVGGVHYPITTSSNGLLFSATATGVHNYPIVQQNLTLVDGQAYRLSFNLLSDETPASANSVFIYGSSGGDGSYRPVNVALGALGVQTNDFIFDAALNNNVNTMRVAIQLGNGDDEVKKVGITGFELVAINNDGNYASVFGSGAVGDFVDQNDSTTWSSYKSGTSSENQDDYQDDTYWPMDGSRYGLDPQHAQANGSFYIDNMSGKIHFSSNINGKTVILDYISDGLGTHAEMVVHKFAEEAMYKWIIYGCISAKIDIRKKDSQLLEQLN